jgi:hypothetical protein
MKLLSKLLILAAVALTASTAFAQVVYVNGTGSNLIAGAHTQYDTYVIISGAQWSTVTNNSVVYAGTSFTAGVNSGGGINGYSTNGLYQPVGNFSNASLRGYVQGSGFTGTGTSITANFLANSPVTISIWGPTLNNYGVSGVGSFSWTVTSSAGTTSGNGEVDLTGQYGNITVTVWAATFAAGDTLIQANG